MTYHSTLLRLLVAGIMLSLPACKKQPAVTECPQITRAPQAFLDYWYFPKGSFWVYRLRGSNPVVYDTMRVTRADESHTTYYSDGDASEPCIQNYQAYVTHSNMTYFPGTGKLGAEAFASDPHFHGYDWVLSHFSDVKTLYSPEVGFGYPIRLGQKLLNRLTSVDTVAVATPAGTFRQSVHLVPDFGAMADSLQANWIRHLYRSRHVGITKVVYTNNQTWELTYFTIKR